MIRDEGGKIFPATMRSRDVLKVLTAELETSGIRIKCGQEVKSISWTEEGFAVHCRDHIYRSRLLVVATGGLSYPTTGSTGNGYGFARCLGHDIAGVGPALTPVIIKDHALPDLAGLSISNIVLSLHRTKKIREARGDILFTHQGLSGPVILIFQDLFEQETDCCYPLRRLKNARLWRDGS